MSNQPMTMEQLEDEIDSCLLAIDKVPDERRVAGIARVCVAVCNAFANTHSPAVDPLPGSERNFIRVKQNTLYNLFAGTGDVTNRNTTPRMERSMREGSTTFAMLHDVLMELYGIKMISPEGWLHDCFVFVNLAHFGPRTFILGAQRAHDMLKLPVPDIPTSLKPEASET